MNKEKCKELLEKIKNAPDETIEKAIDSLSEEMNKEEIEQAKEDLSFFNEGDYITKEMEHSANVLEEYIKQLEKVKEEFYWKGYIEKQKEAVEICKICKYRKRYKELEQKESILDKVTDKLKEDKNKKIPLAEDMDWVICRKQYAREILNIIEGDKQNGNV